MPRLKRNRNTTISSGANIPKRARRTKTQPINVNDASQLPHHLSPCRAIADASQATPPSLSSAATFESRLRDARAETQLATPTEGSSAATIATAEAADEAAEDSFDARFVDNFNSIN